MEVKKIKTEIKLLGQIDKDTFKQFTKDTGEIIDGFKAYLENSREYIGEFPRIKLTIASPGGSTFYGSAILDIINNMQEMGIHVDTYCEGMAYSMAFIIYLMGERRGAGKYATMMNHGSSGGEYGYVEEMKGNVVFSEKQDLMFEQLIYDKTKMSQERVEKARLRCDWIFRDEAVELGIINSENIEELTAVELQEAINKLTDLCVDAFKQELDMNDEDALNLLLYSLMEKAGYEFNEDETSEDNGDETSKETSKETTFVPLCYGESCGNCDRVCEFRK